MRYATLIALPLVLAVTAPAAPADAQVRLGGVAVHANPGGGIASHRAIGGGRGAGRVGSRHAKPIVGPHKGPRRRRGNFIVPLVVERDDPTVIIVPQTPPAPPPEDRPEPERVRLSPATPHTVRVGAGPAERYAVTIAAAAPSAGATARALGRRRDRLVRALDEAGLDWCVAEAGALAIARGPDGFEGTARLVLRTRAGARLAGALDRLGADALAGIERVDAAADTVRPAAGGPVRRRPARTGDVCPVG